MFDSQLRRVLDQPLAVGARVLDRRWITPDRLTGLGLVLGLASAALAATQWWLPALVAWLLSRLVDGLDGPLARRRSADGTGTYAGGFLDITADFISYGAGVAGVAIGATSDPANLGEWVPFVAVLVAYYVNGAAFLAFSAIAERTGDQIDDGRSFSFLGGLAEGGETVLVHSLWLVFPGYASVVAVVWAIVVALSAIQRVVMGYLVLRRP